MTEQGGEALYQVAVRALCEFSAKRGDLDLRFTPSPSALEGIAGHTLVTSRRPAHYQREVALDGRYRHLQVRGRADGCSSRASARRFSPGPSRNWRTASGATANWPRYAFPTPNSATASGNWRRRCTRPPPPVVA